MSDAVDVDGLATRLLAALGRAKPASDGDGYDEDLEGHGSRRGYVPVDRLRKEIAKRQAAEAQVTEFESQVATLASGYQTQLEALQTATADEVGRITSSHAEDLQLMDLGVTDPLGRNTVRQAWSLLPKTDRPKSVTDYYTGLREAQAAHAADPKTAEAPVIPRALQPYLAPVDASATQPRTRATVPASPGPAPARSGELPKGLDFEALLGHLNGTATE